MVYTYFCVYDIKKHDEAKLISKTLLACNLSRSKTQRQSRRLKYALNKASWLRISDWPHNQVSMSIEPSSIDACRGVVIFQYQPHT